MGPTSPRAATARGNSHIVSLFTTVSGSQLAVQELPLLPDVIEQVFFGGIGNARMRRHPNPNPFRNVRTWVGCRRRPVNCSIRSHASAAVRTGSAVSEALIASVKDARSLTGPVTSH